MPSESIGHDADLAIAKAHMRAGDGKRIQRQRASDSSYLVPAMLLGLTLFTGPWALMDSTFLPLPLGFAGLFVVIVALRARKAWRRKRMMDEYVSNRTEQKNA